MRRRSGWWSRRRGELHPLLGVPAFLAAMVLSAPIYGWIDDKVGGSRDSPAMLFPYLCCALMPALALTCAVAAAIQSMLTRGRDRLLEGAIEVAGGPPARRIELPHVDRTLVMYLAAAATLACIGFAVWPRGAPPQDPPPVRPASAEAPTREAEVRRQLAQAEGGDPGAPPEEGPRPRAQALGLAHAAIVKRLSELGVEGLRLEARRITRGGQGWWRVSARGGIEDLVLDVGDGTRPGYFGQPEPLVEIYAPDAAPLEDVEAPEPAEPAPVSSTGGR